MGYCKLRGAAKPAVSERDDLPSLELPKPTQRAGKRAASDEGESQGSSTSSRHQRSWKACQRCHMKKVKCDGNVPCKRCLEKELICVVGLRKTIEYKELPKSCTEALEYTQLAFVHTIHKLYSMVRNGQQWDLEEPDLNENGQPIIHSIAQSLGCVQEHGNASLYINSFSIDYAGKDNPVPRSKRQQVPESDSIKENDMHVYTTDQVSDMASNRPYTDQDNLRTGFCSDRDSPLLLKSFNSLDQPELGIVPDTDATFSSPFSATNSDVRTAATAASTNMGMQAFNHDLAEYGFEVDLAWLTGIMSAFDDPIFFNHNAATQ